LRPASKSGILVANPIAHLEVSMSKSFAAVLLAAVLLGAPTPGIADDWVNSGGNAGRNGLSSETGPTGPDLAWSGGRSSLIAWLPVTEGERAFMVRQPRWPDQQPNDAFIVATDIQTGAELWAMVLPYSAGDWIPWIAGVKNGKVYASRSGNGASVSARMVALDVTDGHTVWISQDLQDAGAYDGVVFAADGDPIVASFQDIWRFNAEDGTTVWHALRTGSVSGSCGGALYGEAFYVADAVPGGHAIVRYDAATGARLYQSPTMPGFTLQNTPMVGPDGTVYLSRTQNNPAVDFYYAFLDTGTQFTEKWHVPSYNGPFAEFGVGPDGSLYLVVPGPRLARIDPATGAVWNQTDVLSGFTAAHVAVDANGGVFCSNGAFGTGRLYAYDPDLSPRWSVAVPNVNVGGPSLGRYGTLIVCGTGTDVRAYRSIDPADVAGPSSPVGDAVAVVATPNPFRDDTALRFTLARPGPIGVRIYDALGTEVRALVDGEARPSGIQTVAWDGRSNTGAPVPSGVYYFRVDAGGASRTGRMTLAR
jgi:hypothetical protein